MKFTGTLLLILITVVFSNAQQQVQFSAADGIKVTADLYEINTSAPVILLAHQARFSRGEYKDIALRLNQMGFNALAIDQRSGKTVNGVSNETHKIAASVGMPTSFQDARPDIEAGINYVKSRYNRSVILWGSSYSASLALIIAKTNSDVLAALAFSPGEYFNGTPSVAASSAGITKPVFVTSTKSEAKEIASIIDGLKNVDQFVPKGTGVHGSKALWADSAEQAEYWAAVSAFLDRLK